MQLESKDLEAFTETGDRASNPPRQCVTFVHGAGQDHSIRDLPTRHSAGQDLNELAVDLPGQGRFRGKALAAAEAIADWLVCALDEAGIRTAAVVGRRLGSLAALAAAIRRPDKARALALIGTALPMQVNEGLLKPPARESSLRTWMPAN